MSRLEELKRERDEAEKEYLETLDPRDLAEFLNLSIQVATIENK